MVIRCGGCAGEDDDGGQDDTGGKVGGRVI